jgi:hypothetical protein
VTHPAHPQPLAEEEFAELDPYEAAAARQEWAAQLEALAEETPVAAVDVIAGLRAEEMKAQFEQQLAPVFARYNRDEAASAIDQLRAAVGDDRLLPSVMDRPSALLRRPVPWKWRSCKSCSRDPRTTSRASRYAIRRLRMRTS